MDTERAPNQCVERTGKRRHFVPPFLPAAHAYR
jgi:hypothetical protein